jgi:hypothetical protein
MTYAHDSLPDVQLQKRPIPTDYYCCFRLQLKPGVHQINVWAQTESQEFQKCSAMVTPVVHANIFVVTIWHICEAPNGESSMYSTLKRC